MRKGQPGCSELEVFVQVEWLVDESTADEAAELFHGSHPRPLVSGRVVALGGGQDGLVVPVAAGHVDLALVGHHRTTEPRLKHLSNLCPLVLGRVVPETYMARYIIVQTLRL